MHLVISIKGAGPDNSDCNYALEIVYNENYIALIGIFWNCLYESNLRKLNYANNRASCVGVTVLTSAYYLRK